MNLSGQKDTNNDEFTFGSLFTGIGGIDLGLERAGMVCKWQVEIDPFCLKVLEKHWPDVKRYEDVRNCGKHNLEPVALVCGGFPCQPISRVGKRKGKSDPRWLWPQFARIVSELRPRFVLVENVPGLLRRGMGDILIDLASCGYDAEWQCLPATLIGALHLRHRVFIVAYYNPENKAYASSSNPDSQRFHRKESNSEGQGGQIQSRNKQGSIFGPLGADVAHTDGKGLERAWLQGAIAKCGWWEVEPGMGRVADGVPDRVDRLKSLGNAVVPQVAEWIGRQIMEVYVNAVAKPVGDGADGLGL